MRLHDLVQPAERSPYANVAHFDLSQMPVQLTAQKWNPRKVRDPAKFRGIVLHAWDTPVGTTAANRARFNEVGALARRALGAPYTISAGVARHSSEPMVVLAHPLERYTYASDAACSEWLAVGVMGRFAFDDDEVAADSAKPYTEVTESLTLAVGAALDLAVRLMAGEDRDAGPFALITHRQGINGRGDHAECPGEAVIRMALQSEAVRRGAIVPEPDLVLLPEWGRPWPDAWRRHLPSFAPPQAAPTPKRVTMRLPADLPPLPIVGEQRGGDLG